MSTTTPTTPIPNRLPAPNPAPNRPSECPRCGAPAISTRGVALHDLWHREQDARHRKLDAILAALEDMLAAFDGDPTDDPDDGEPKTFRAWVQETDHILDTLAGKLEEHGRAIADADGRKTADPAAEIELLPWPGDPGPADEDETVEPDDSAPPANPAEPYVEASDATAPAGIDEDLDGDYIDLPPNPPHLDSVGRF